MKNTLADLNNYLFETLERLMDDSLSEGELHQEIARSKAVTAVADAVIQNGDLALRAKKHADEYGYGKGTEQDRGLPAMLEGI